MLASILYLFFLSLHVDFYYCRYWGGCPGSGGLHVLHDIVPWASCRDFRVRSGATAAAATA